MRERQVSGPSRVLLVGLALAAAGYGPARADTVVGSSAELVAALATASSGDVVRLRSGDYLLERSLHIPDGVTLHGGGSGRAAGEDEVRGDYAGHDAATVRSAESLDGDLLVLGDRAVVQGLRIVRAPPATGSPESGNGIVVASRRADDRIAATVRDCDFQTNATFGANARGPTGRAVAVMTRNPGGDAPHRSARVELTIERSAIRAPQGNAVFVNNFAAQGSLHVVVRHSLIEGFISVSGGTSRGQLVSGARTYFQSEYSRYRRVEDGVDWQAWQLFGASGTPLAVGDHTVPGGVDNRLRFESDRDRIEGFRIGVLATGFRRVADFSAPGIGNTLELRLRDTQIRTEGDGAADLVLRGAVADPGPQNDLRLAPGERNLVRAELRGVVGSGPRANRYVDCDCPPGQPLDGNGNRVLIEGEASGFATANSRLQPPPPAAAFGQVSR